jgi:hypothetical protein
LLLRWRSRREAEREAAVDALSGVTDGSGDFHALPPITGSPGAPGNWVPRGGLWKGPP